MIAHPRASSSPIRSSILFANELALLNDEQRLDLYDLTDFEFLLLSHAFEPNRAWGSPWMDWDDLDLLENSSPSFTRNVQLSIDRPSFLGGYHALRLPWRNGQSEGLGVAEQEDEPLETLTINMLGRFLSSLSRPQVLKN